jgi:hypothetical protein
MPLLAGLWSREPALETEERILQLQGEPFALVLFTLGQSLNFKCQFAQSFIGVGKPALQSGDLLFQPLKVALLEKRLLDEIKELLQHGGGWPRFRSKYGDSTHEAAGFRYPFVSFGRG